VERWLDPVYVPVLFAVDKQIVKPRPLNFTHRFGPQLDLADQIIRTPDLGSENGPTSFRSDRDSRRNLVLKILEEYVSFVVDFATTEYHTAHPKLCLLRKLYNLTVVEPDYSWTGLTAD
jgi:hypothetical protein